MTGAVSASDFPAFFRALHRNDKGEEFDPFPWQTTLVDQVAETGVWPRLLDLPTGTGKTAALDAAVFLLALRDDQPRRVVFVVDRRMIVHQAAQHARHIATQLATARDGVLFDVAQRLRLLARLPDAEAPLGYAELRGGIVRDDGWVRRPDVPTVIVSTVDQVGSRLLFRGYGVSNGMRPVHAGLLGNDVLYLLDEVHLARPFAHTLAEIRRRCRPAPGSGLPDRFAVTELSATPGTDHPTDQVLRLGPEDRDPEVTPILARRLAARKPARLHPVPVSVTDGAEQRTALAEAAVAQACALLDQQEVRTVGIVVNRVDTAARAYRLLDHRGVDAVLLTGRMRPRDRDRVIAEHESRLRTGRDRDAAAAPLVLVATQAVEAGADFDLDALVTECAPLDALIQRFGRVDRDGKRSERDMAATSVILATSASVSAAADDPIYGDRLRKAWAWLHAQRGLDFGIDEFQNSQVSAQVREELSTPAAQAPFLMPSHLDRWVQTSARPDADPDPAHWLHGTRPSATDVNVVWRADVLAESFSPWTPGEDRDTVAARVAAVVAQAPPGSTEAMALPVTAVRAWLADLRTRIADPHAGPSNGEITSFGDTTVEPAEAAPTRRSGRPVPLAPALSWRGDESTLVTTASEIRPGATLVVPAIYGGIQAHNWDPSARDAVPDLGTEVQARQRARAVLRLHPALTLAAGESAPEPVPGDDEFDREIALDWLGLLAAASPDDAGTDSALWDVVAVLGYRKAAKHVDVVRVEIAPPSAPGQPPRQMYVIRSRRRVAALSRPPSQLGNEPEAATDRLGADSEPATSSFLGTEVLLDKHLADVTEWAEWLAEGCGFPNVVASDVALAARLHDLGKVDERFQLLLRAGVLTDATTPLAKSLLPATEYHERRRAAQAAGYPHNTRHELASVALVQHDEQLQAQAHDWDLVLHLIASHHGYARPFVPVSVDPDPRPLRAVIDGRALEACSDHELLRLDSGVPQRFWRCVRRYGWYGLAWMEAVLRLADHRASEERAG